jgi:seryl-tRNA synthetase
VIDLRLLHDDPELFRASQRLRGADPGAVDTLLAADDRRRASVSRADALRAQQKALSRKVGRAAPAEREGLLARAKQLAADVKEAEVDEVAAAEAVRRAQLNIANLVEDGVPPGGVDDFVELARHGEPPLLEAPRDHVEIGAALRAIDTERGAKVSGSRFYFLTGVGAQLEFALVNLAMQFAERAGLTPVIAPALVKPEVMEGTGFLGAHAAEVYRLADDELYLVGTSEVALAGYHSGEILDAAELPLRYAGFSSCFRREAGSYGKDTRGIIRVHWFDKVEMFSYTRAEAALDEHKQLLAWEREFLDSLELSYRVVDIAAEDLGTSAARKYDIEAWFPSQGTYRELTSTSNCTTFQSRRLNIRTRGAAGTEFVATLNGTLCAVARTIACLLDHHQQPDGSVYVPKALRPWLGDRELLSAQ